MGLALATAASSLPAAAQPPAHRATVEETQGSVSAADRHFRRGVDLYADGDMSGAFVEFSRAYELVANYKILYNLGQVAYRRQDYVRALGHFRGYLAGGADAIAPGRRRQVEEDIARLEQRVGHIAIDVAADDRGAEIRLDDLQVATAPLLEPLAASVGPRKVALVRASGDSQVRIVDVVGGETTRVRFPPSVLRLVADPDALSRGAAADQPWQLAENAQRSPTVVNAKSGLRTWIGWSAAGLLAAGAAVTGVMAYSSSRDLQQRRESYPLAAGDLDAMGQRAHLLAVTTDGLLIGAAAVAAVSLYLTLRNPTEEPPSARGGADRLSSAADERRRHQ